ncbi:carboxymuconolactone decarboxylase family protein [Streptomyces sp. NBC_01381]|uniref:carboxymuconolactone decarboxylase family protein n=1 Tax=Streptomyces sp. NBC_01381 TaxID=2903845 RepID=UPI002252FEC5|nr:carboxymuconolactone decarboxylase family protein [Streptomyces sp. NBC_01381]MCX4671255.1 carboxymuconolactone decarboxylase family protein [Streptomyces sp. NBC_01381]
MATFRYTDPVLPKSATGRTADAYAQMAVDFGLAEPAPLVALSPAPELFTATWALLRESLLAGDGTPGDGTPGDGTPGGSTRTDRELVAVGVSLANRCPFCVSAHTVMLHATGDHRVAERVLRGEQPDDPDQARLLAWGKATRTPGAPELAPPFPRAHAPAHIGTALTFHFINRVASSLMTERMLPCNAQRLRVVRSLGGRSLQKAVRRTVTPGDSLALLDEPLPGPDWAAGSPVGPAYAALRAAATMGASLLDDTDQRLVEETLASWDGAHPPMVWESLPDRTSRPGARLALLAALAPYRITDEDVAAWKKPPFSDHCLVHLISYGAFAAVDRIESGITAHLTREAS